jgi:flagellar motor protein MotB
LLNHGVAPQQIKKVAGFGDTVPMPNSDPRDEINRRVTVLLNIKSSKS